MIKAKRTLQHCLMAGLCFILLSTLLQITIAYAEEAITPSSALDFAQQTARFLVVPYFDGAVRTAYMDSDLPYSVNGEMLLYDGRRLNATTHGICNQNDQTPAYFAQPNNPNAECIWYDGHTGNDFGLSYKPVVAAAAGTLVKAGWQNPFDRDVALGLYIELAHANSYHTRYGHMSAVLTRTLTIAQRQFIGVSGNTGNSGGPHLHFEVFHIVDGVEVFVDPFRTADYLWQEGSFFASQWFGRLGPTYDITHTVDNDAPTFQKGRIVNGYYATCPPETCPFWQRATTGGVGNSNFYWTYDNFTSDYWARWAPPATGEFFVEAWIPHLQFANPVTVTVSWQAVYCPVSARYGVAVSDGCIHIDQVGSQGRWIALGAFAFGAYPHQPWSAIQVSDQFPVPIGYERANLGVDALRFRGVILDEAVYLPTVQSATSVIAAHEPP